MCSPYKRVVLSNTEQITKIKINRIINITKMQKIGIFYTSFVITGAFFVFCFVFIFPLLVLDEKEFFLGLDVFFVDANDDFGAAFFDFIVGFFNGSISFSR